MLGLPSQELYAKLTALDRSQAVIEFKLDGTILAANQNFLSQILGSGLSATLRSSAGPLYASS